MTTCVNCDTPLIEGHRFCRVCGRRAEPAQRTPPPVDPVVDGCPSCGRQSTSGERFCRTCGTALTEDAGAARPSRALPAPDARAAKPPPAARAVAPRRPPAASTQHNAPAMVSAPPAQDPPTTSGRSKRLRIALLATLGVLVLAGGVLGGITFLAADDKPAEGSGPEVGSASTDASQKQQSVLPSISAAEMTAKIRQTFAEYYQHIIDGDPDAAFKLLSARKQTAALRTDGLDAWKRAQAALTSFLDPSALVVEIDYADPVTGVVRVKLSGMTYTNPSSSCSIWSGITWVKYEGGAFHYDPGYSTTPQRTRDWQARESELLGTGC